MVYRQNVDHGPSLEPRDLRAADSDRERTVELLREAAADGRLTLDEHSERMERAYAARKLGELTDLTRDLAGPTAQPLAADARPAVAFFGSEERRGRWVVPTRQPALSVCGNVVLDLREALLQRRELVIDATAICGGIEVIVPEGVEVRMSGKAVLGGKSSKVRGPVEPGGPVVEIRCHIFCGTVSAKSPRRRWFGLGGPR
ncbi:MAG: DUF1707 SHOCT-like domain-containing protein [Streptosporangiaceae bacterium]